MITSAQTATAPDMIKGTTSALSAVGEALADATVMPQTLNAGEQYRLVRAQFAGYNHVPNYDEGAHVVVRVVNGPDEMGFYKCTTWGDDGKHLGPGGGWTRDYEEQPGCCCFYRHQLEPLS